MDLFFLLCSNLVSYISHDEFCFFIIFIDDRNYSSNKKYYIRKNMVGIISQYLLFYFHEYKFLPPQPWSYYGITFPYSLRGKEIDGKGDSIAK